MKGKLILVSQYSLETNITINKLNYIYHVFLSHGIFSKITGLGPHFTTMQKEDHSVQTIRITISMKLFLEKNIAGTNIQIDKGEKSSYAYREKNKTNSQYIYYLFV